MAVAWLYWACEVNCPEQVKPHPALILFFFLEPASVCKCLQSRAAACGPQQLLVQPALCAAGSCTSWPGSMRRPACPFSASQVINKTHCSFHSTAYEHPVVLCSCCDCARCSSGLRLKCVLCAGFVPSLFPMLQITEPDAGV